MRFDIVRARDQLPMDGPDMSCDQVRVLQIAKPDRTIETLCDEINKAITVIGMNVELRVASRHFREHGSQVSWAESKRRGNSQAAAKLAVGQEHFPGRVDLGTDFGCMVPKYDSGFCESGAARRACKKLHAKFRFKPGELPTDD